MTGAGRPLDGGFVKCLRLVAIAFFVGPAARADTVWMTDGRAVDGAAVVDGHDLRVGGAAVPIDDVLVATFARRVRTGPQSCVLVDGTVLAGRVDGIDDRVVRMTTASLGRVSVGVGRVARVCFEPVPGERLSGVSGGLLLRDGDFFEGAFQRLDGAGVTLVSPLLGEATFGVADRAAAWVVRPAARADGDWVVRTTDGSVLVANSLSLAGGAASAEVMGVGSLAVPLGDVAEVRAGGDRVASLADRVPVAGSAVADGTPIGLAPRLVGGAVGRSVCVPAGGSATYQLDGATALACRVGVPAGLVPTAAVRWSVAVDGRTVATGGPVTSVDDPVLVGVPTAGAGQLTLAVEPGAGVALFADPVLARAGGAATRPR